MRKDLPPGDFGGTLAAGTDQIALGLIDAGMFVVRVVVIEIPNYRL